MEWTNIAGTVPLNQPLEKISNNAGLEESHIWRGDHYSWGSAWGNIRVTFLCSIILCTLLRFGPSVPKGPFTQNGMEAAVLYALYQMTLKSNRADLGALCSESVLFTLSTWKKAEQHHEPFKVIFSECSPMWTDLEKVSFDFSTYAGILYTPFVCLGPCWYKSGKVSILASLFWRWFGRPHCQVHLN